MEQNLNENLPKKRGRKPGSKNKTKTGKKVNSNKGDSLFLQLEKELALFAVSLQKAQMQAEKELQRIEMRYKREMEMQKDKLERSVKLWKNRAKDYRKQILVGGAKKRKVGRPASTVLKTMAKRGRPAKASLIKRGGGRKRAGELTKRDIVINYMKEYKKPISSKDLIANLFAQSGEKDLKRFSQGIYTTLTQIYKRGDLKNIDGIIQLA
jgi:hypothetical protein